MGSKSAPAPPDYSEVSEASEENAKLAAEVAREQLAWAKEQYGKDQKVIQQVLGVTLPTMQQQYENARGDRARYEEVFQPVEDELVAEATGFDTAERRQREAGEAIADTRFAFEQERQNAEQRLAGLGADPSQIRAGALDLNFRIGEATAAAGAGNFARKNVENTGRALRGEAVNLGRGYPSQVAQSYGQAVAAGQSGAGTQLQGTQVAGQSLTQPNAWLGASNQALNTYGNALNSSYRNQIAGFNAQQDSSPWGGIGLIAGSALGGPLGGALGRAIFADGGEAEVSALPGGGVSGPTDGSGVDDRVPAMLSHGEYVVPADVVKRKGTEFFDKLIEKHHTPADIQRDQQRALPIGRG